MIVYKKTPHLRLTRAQVPEAPYWAATTIAPYSARRAAPIAVDHIDLRASGPGPGLRVTFTPGGTFGQAKLPLRELLP